MSPVSVIVAVCWAVFAVGLLLRGVLDELAWRRADEPSPNDPEFTDPDTQPGTDPDLLRTCQHILRAADRQEDER